VAGLLSPGAARFTVRGRLVSDGDSVPDGLVAVEGGRIAYAGPAAGFDAAGFDGERAAAPEDALILPGLVDLHCHGAVGADFPSAGEAEARRAIGFLHRSGTTTLLASLVTAAPSELLRGAALFAGLRAEGLVEGIHAEGPFLSHARCGAQNPAFLRDPDLGLAARLVEASRGALRTMTYAAELPGAAELVALLAAHGVVPSLGHTDADDGAAAASLRDAAEALADGPAGGTGAVPTVTHLFNGMPPLHHRSPGPVAACLRAAAAGNAVVELVADGVHLDPATVRTVFSLAGASSIALVTDSMAAAGLADGRYMLGPSPVTVAGGVARLDATGSIAGGTATLLDVVRRTVQAGIPVEDAVLSATAVPARVLGLADDRGSLRAGLRADLVVTDAGLNLAGVVRGGRALPAPDGAPTRGQRALAQDRA
jgi:N-acetylglucosamine-6-phosphate deacetylase